jgi:hypothetical protein
VSLARELAYILRVFAFVFAEHGAINADFERLEVDAVSFKEIVCEFVVFIHG